MFSLYVVLICTIFIMNKKKTKKNTDCADNTGYIGVLWEIFLCHDTLKDTLTGTSESSDYMAPYKLFY